MDIFTVMEYNNVNSTIGRRFNMNRAKSIFITTFFILAGLGVGLYSFDYAFAAGG